MDHSSLVALFRRIVLAGPPLLLSVGFNAGCGIGFDPCSNAPADVTETLTINQTDAGSGAGVVDASIDDLIARCQKSSSDLRAALRTGSVAANEPATNQVLQDHHGRRRPRGPHRLQLRLRGRALPRRLGRSSVPGGRGRARRLAGSKRTPGSRVHRCVRDSRRGARRASRASLIDSGRPDHATVDERRHSEVIGRLAVSRGAVPPAAYVKRGPVRDIEAVARENAVEGCVRETYAAMLASPAGVRGDRSRRSGPRWPASRATRPRHAALAWAVDGWSQALLPPAARRRVREARREALEQLVEAPLAGLPSDDRAQAGPPDKDDAARMAVELGAALV